MKNRIINFKSIDAEGKETNMTLSFSDNPTITCNDVEYKAIMPGEMLTDEAIKNPQPLPKNTYAFKVDGNIYLVVKTRLNGIIIQPLNPKLFVLYDGKNKFEKILKIVLTIVVIISVGFTLFIVSQSLFQK